MKNQPMMIIYCLAISRKRQKITKKQDKEAKRKIPKDNYINVEWFFDNIGKICPICQKEDLNYEINDGNVTSNITADRLDCLGVHNLDNIQPCCITCNVMKSNRSTNL